jgi:hypothetical protein
MTHSSLPTSILAPYCPRNTSLQLIERTYAKKMQPTPAPNAAPFNHSKSYRGMGLSESRYIEYTTLGVRQRSYHRHQRCFRFLELIHFAAHISTSTRSYRHLTRAMEGSVF